METENPKLMIDTSKLMAFREGLAIAEEKGMEFKYMDMVFFLVGKEPDRDIVDVVYAALSSLNLLKIKGVKE